jgi:hypothetical protein
MDREAGPYIICSQTVPVVGGIASEACVVDEAAVSGICHG